MKVAAILPAAGLGTRMGKASETGTRKQWIELAGTPVVIHTLRRFDEASSIDEIVVALRDEDRAPLEQHLAEESFSKSIRLVDGGRTRQESVQNGLAAVSPDVSIVSVHDAVRPLISVDLIDRSVEQAQALGVRGAIDDAEARRPVDGAETPLADELHSFRARFTPKLYCFDPLPTPIIHYFMLPSFFFDSSICAFVIKQTADFQCPLN